MLLELFEMLASVADVDEHYLRRNMGVGHDDANVSVGREKVDKCREFRVAHFHELKTKNRGGQY